MLNVERFSYITCWFLVLLIQKDCKVMIVSIKETNILLEKWNLILFVLGKIVRTLIKAY